MKKEPTVEERYNRHKKQIDAAKLERYQCKELIASVGFIGYYIVDKDGRGCTGGRDTIKEAWLAFVEDIS